MAINGLLGGWLASLSRPEQRLKPNRQRRCQDRWLNSKTRFEGRKRVLMAAIAAERIVHHLARSRFIVMKKLSLGGHSAFQGVGNGPFLPRHGFLGPLGSRLENHQVTPSTRR